MSANTETTGADRTGCKAWCGKRSLDSAVPAGGGMDGPVTFVRGDMYDSARIAYCSQSCRDARLPPIAAPAAHVERRKGQRWVVKRDDQPAYETTLDARDCDGWFTVSSRGGGWIHDDCWDLPAYTMTLLADATPEPGSPFCCDLTAFGPGGCNCKSQPAQEAPITIVCAKGCGRSTVNDERAMSFTCKQCSAQEAPKAAPAQFWFTDDEGEKIGPFATGLEADDASVAYGAWMRTQTGKPYAGPERLPKPHLAADWVEDCLGDVR